MYICISWFWQLSWLKVNWCWKEKGWLFIIGWCVFDDDIGYYLVFLMIEHFLNSSKYGNITKIRFFYSFCDGSVMNSVWGEIIQKSLVIMMIFGRGFVKKVQWLAAFFKTFVFDEIYNLHNQQEDDFSAFFINWMVFSKINWT